VNELNACWHVAAMIASAGIVLGVLALCRVMQIAALVRRHDSGEGLTQAMEETSDETP
jgi:hypothetical protein